MRSGIFPLPLTEGEGRGKYQDGPIFDDERVAMTEHDIRLHELRLLERVANVFASYKVDPHDEGVPVQEVVDHLIRCVGFLLPDCDYGWFTSHAALGVPLWRYHEHYDEDGVPMQVG